MFPIASKSPIPLLFVAVFLAALASPAGAADDNAAAGPATRRLICYDDIFPPYFIRRGDILTGLNVDVLAEAAKRIGVTVEFRSMPFKRIEYELQQGKNGTVDCAFAFSRTPHREAYMDFGTAPLQVSDYTLFVRDDQTDIVTLEDLAGKTIGVRRGFRVPEALETGEREGRFKLEAVDSDESNFLKLSRRRVDAVLTIRDVGYYVLGQLHIDSIRTLSPPVQHLDNFLVFNKGKSLGVLMPEFDRALAQMQQDGTYANLKGRYLPP